MKPRKKRRRSRKGKPMSPKAKVGQTRNTKRRKNSGPGTTRNGRGINGGVTIVKKKTMMAPRNRRGMVGLSRYKPLRGRSSQILASTCPQISVSDAPVPSIDNCQRCPKQLPSTGVYNFLFVINMTTILRFLPGNYSRPPLCCDTEQRVCCSQRMPQACSESDG